MKASEQKQSVGSLRISRDVIATIAGTAAREIEGVYSLAPAPVDLRGMLAKRHLPRSVGIALSDDIAVIDLQLILRDGTRISSISERVQQSVKESVQSMTGITVSKVNVTISGIHFDAPEQS
ncbi:MAG: Asp23/Gls24 family envelope stress response protein [Oscillospiraceae bacterium]